MVGLKRVRAPRPGGRNRTFKRRKTTGRRRTNRRAGNKSYSSRSVATTNAGYRKPLTKAKRRQFKRNLWNATDVMQKYRSNISGTYTQLTPLGVTSGSYTLIPAMTTTTPFWTVSGGLEEVNFGGGAPTLDPNVVFLRGGALDIQGSLASNAGDPVRLRIQLIYPKQQLRNAADTADTSPFATWIAAIPSTFTQSRTLQDLPDYDEYLYRPVMDKEILLRPGENMVLKHKLRAKKIDCDQFTRAMGSTPYWMTYSWQTFDSGAGAQETIQFNYSYSVSFTVADL